MRKQTVKGLALASAVGALFAAGAARAETKAATKEKQGGPVRCAGVNGCKGQGACATAKNSCAGANACKGQGWVEEKTAQACTDKGGSVVATK
jgi:hypothetical protein